MDGIYSIALLVSLVAGGFALTLSVLEHFATLRARLPGALRNAAVLARTVISLVALALAASLLSFFVHLSWGHGPNTPEPMPFTSFLAAHRAYFFAGLLLVSAVFLHAVRSSAD